MGTMLNLKANFKAALSVLRQHKLTFFITWFITLSFFLWVTKLNLLAYIFGQPSITPVGKVLFVLGAYVNYFTYIISPVALTSLIFTVLAAANITLLIHFTRNAKRSGMVKGNTGALVALIGSHCLSCGGSLAAPLITALAGTGTYFSAERFATGQLLATGANLVGIILILLSIRGVLRRFWQEAALVRTTI